MTGAERIAAERQRQVDVEEWTPEHDAEHDGYQLVFAAIAYAVASCDSPCADLPSSPLDWWPWNPWKFKGFHGEGGGRVRMLEKAGALIAAEIDRTLATEEAS